MYYCQACEHFFEEPIIDREAEFYGEVYDKVCPYCRSISYTWKGDPE